MGVMHAPSRTRSRLTVVSRLLLAIELPRLRHGAGVVCCALAALGYLGVACATVPVTHVGRTDQVEHTAPIAVAVWPTQTIAGHAVQITWRVEPDDLNREWCIAFEGEAPWRRFCEQSFRRIRQELLQPPAGKYDVTLTVTRGDRTTRRVSTPLCVASMDVSCSADSLFQIPESEIRGGTDGPF